MPDLIKRAIRRLIRGQDGRTKVIFIDLATFQEIADLTGYKVLDSGNPEPEPVADVDKPDEAPSDRGVGSSVVQETRRGSTGDRQSSMSKNPAIRNYLEGMARPQTVQNPSVQTQNPQTQTQNPNPVDPRQSTPAAPSTPGAVPAGYVKTAQGSLLPELDMNKFGNVMEAFGPRTPQEVSTIAGNANVNPLERELENRQELQNIKDMSQTAPTPTGSPSTFAGRPEVPGTNAGYTPAAPEQPSFSFMDRPTVTGSLPAASPRSNFAARPEVPGSLPGSTPSGFLARPEVPGSYQRNTPNVGMARPEVPGSLPGSTPSTFAGRPEVVGQNLADLQASRAQPVDYSTPSERNAASRPSANTPSSPMNPNSVNRTKDDFAHAAPGIAQTNSIFDVPSREHPTSVARSVIEKAKDVSAPSSVTASRNTGLATRAYDNPNKGKTTTFEDAAGYSKTDVTGNRGARNNNPGNLEASGWTKGQAGYIGTDGRFAAFDTRENGIKAQANLLGTSKYQSKTIAGAISLYAPEFENNTKGYAAAVAAAVGVPVGTKMSELTPAQRETMVEAMHEVEGSNARTTRETSLTEKGVFARDHYTGLGTGPDTPSERNAADRPSANGGIAGGGSSNHSTERERDTSLGGRSTSGSGSSSGSGTGTSRGGSAGISGGGGYSPGGMNSPSGSSSGSRGGTSSGSSGNNSGTSTGSGAGTNSSGASRGAQSRSDGWE